MAIYTAGRETFFGQLPSTKAGELLTYEQFLTMLVQDCESESREQALQALKHAVLALSALVCVPHAMDDFEFQVLDLNRDECTRDVHMTPRCRDHHQRSIVLHTQLSTGGELLYVSDVTVRAYFPKTI